MNFWLPQVRPLKWINVLQCNIHCVPLLQGRKQSNNLLRRDISLVKKQMAFGKHCNLFYFFSRIEKTFYHSADILYKGNDGNLEKKYYHSVLLCYIKLKRLILKQWLKTYGPNSNRRNPNPLSPNLHIVTFKKFLLIICCLCILLIWDINCIEKKNYHQVWMITKQASH